MKDSQERVALKTIIELNRQGIEYELSVYHDDPVRLTIYYKNQFYLYLIGGGNESVYDLIDNRIMDIIEDRKNEELARQRVILVQRLRNLFSKEERELLGFIE